MFRWLKNAFLWPIRIFKRKDFKTLKHLLNSSEIDPNRRKRAYSESETIAYLTRKITSLEKSVKRIESKTDSVRDRFDNYIRTVEKEGGSKNVAADKKEPGN